MRQIPKERVPRMAGLTFTDELALMIANGTKTESRRPITAKSMVPKLQTGDYLYGRVTLIRDDKTASHEPIYRFMCSEVVQAELSVFHNWTPAIHAPQSNAPFMLDLIDVHDEQLHAITEEGAKAEGADVQFRIEASGYQGLAEFARGVVLPKSTHRIGFRHLWDDIYGKTAVAWDKNPMVRVFKWKNARLHDTLHGQLVRLC